MSITEQFNNILHSFKINAECINHRRVRNISLYDMTLSNGTKIKDISQYLDEISLALRSQSKPNLKIIPQNGILQMEVVDSTPQKISFLNEYRKLPKQDGLLPVYIGNSVNGNDIIFDLAKNPHMLVAGTTGSGKSVLLHTILGNMLSYPDVMTYIIDPKNIEFSAYQPKNNVQVFNSFSDAIECLNYLINVMEDRYDIMKKNGLPATYFLSEQKYYHKILLIIDEFADLIMQDTNKILHKLICRLAQKCRASGIFAILATQRPSVATINGEIKANFPARIAFQTASSIDSRIILDNSGAEILSGSGDGIIKNYLYDFQRFQSAYSDPQELLS